jgi:hypothetical protein
VRATLRSTFGVVLLSVCVGAPIAELFDQWDHTAQDGNDTEANLVVVVVCIGIGFVTGATILRCVRPTTNAHRIDRTLASLAGATALCAIAPTPSNSPPSVLRI